MKLKVTKRTLQNNYSRIISIGYCDAQTLLRYMEPFSYCVRAEGWVCDNYNVDGILISTGYSPINNKNTKRDYTIVNEYESKARKISTNYNLTWKEQKEEVEKLLKQFIQECICE